MQGHELNFVDKVLDNVHGFIWYTEAEKKIIDNLLFKRLQSIKQLSLVNWVFPGSEHTRFIHSLGVMHIADRMAVALGLSPEQRKIVRLAGLLHDIGHYPLSHVCEFPYKKKMLQHPEADFCKTVNEDVLTRIKNYSFEVETEFMKSAKNGHHEDIGAQVIQNSSYLREVIVDECGEKAIDTICDMITGTIREDADNELLVQILHSELDADGIDYMLRDAMFSGTSFGSFELDQLIANLCVREYNGKKILCINPKGIAAADQYLINKFFSYSQVVFNKHTSILEWMAEQIVSWMQEKAAYFPARDTLRTEWVTKENEAKFLAFTDDFFWHSLRDIVNNPAKNSFPPHIVSLSRALLNHQECEYVEDSEIKVIAYDHTAIKRRLKEVPKSISPEEVILFTERSMSKHVRLTEFMKKIKAPDVEGQEDASEVEQYKNDILCKRLIEGICVADNSELHLLCDDKRSLMQELYKAHLLIIRRYKMPQMKES